MNNVLFTSDTHYSHANILKYCNRPFANVQEMNEKLINNYNEVVGVDDICFHLGDFGFGSVYETNKIVSRLNGKKILILGNHDERVKNQLKGFESINQKLSIEINGQWFFMFHYAMRTWDKAHYGSTNLFGHSHNKLPDIGLRQMDVGVDCNNYYPFSFEQVIEKMKGRTMGILKEDERRT